MSKLVNKMTSSQEDELKTALLSVFVSWYTQQYISDQPGVDKLTEKWEKEQGEDCFIYQVLKKRMESFNTGIIVPLHLGIIIESCTNSNPAMSLMMLAEILEHLEKPIKKPYRLQTSDFSRVYDEFPILDIDYKLYERLEKKWNDQKMKLPLANPLDDNMVDHPDYWRKLVM